MAPGLSSTVEKWQALYSLLEAFGNSPTIMNGNATRFSQILSLDFDQAGQVASASIQVRDLQGGKRSAWTQGIETSLSPAPGFPGIFTPRKWTLALRAGLLHSGHSPFCPQCLLSPQLSAPPPPPLALSGACLRVLPTLGVGFTLLLGPGPVLRGFSLANFTQVKTGLSVK